MQLLLDNHFIIPLEMIQFCYDNNLQKPLLIFLYLKSISNGIINKSELCYEDIKARTGIKDKRSANRYLNILLEINWLGYNKQTRNFFIRSFSSIRKSLGFTKRTGVYFEIDYLLKYKGFIEGAIICSHLKKQEYARKAKIRQKVGIAALKKSGALQANMPIDGVSDYVGMSNFRLSRLLSCSMSHANRAKSLAEKQGYIATKEHFSLLAEISKPDYQLRDYSVHPGKIRFKKRYKNGKVSILVLKQLYDEITPIIQFKRIPKI